MKLRNKKTGEIVDVESLGHAESLKEKYGYQVTLSWKTKYENLSQCKSYEFLAELNDEWEDYKTAEPLIKDEKVRKAVRAWAKANGISGCICKEEIHCITFETERGMFISFENADPIPPEGNFTITELCGEEED